MRPHRATDARPISDRDGPRCFSANEIACRKGDNQNGTTTAYLAKDLPNAVKHLSDSELDLIRAATLEEMKRRGRMPEGVETDLQTLRHRFDVRPDLMKRKLALTEKRPTVETEVPLTLGQVNAVRAAFKAGITPSRIARQFWFVSIERAKGVAI